MKKCWMLLHWMVWHGSEISLAGNGDNVHILHFLHQGQWSNCNVGVSLEWPTLPVIWHWTACYHFPSITQTLMEQFCSKGARRCQTAGQGWKLLEPPASDTDSDSGGSNLADSASISPACGQVMHSSLTPADALTQQEALRFPITSKQHQSGRVRQQ